MEASLRSAAQLWKQWCRMASLAIWPRRSWSLCLGEDGLEQLLESVWKLLICEPPAGLNQPLHECVCFHAGSLNSFISCHHRISSVDQWTPHSWWTRPAISVEKMQRNLSYFAAKNVWLFVNYFTPKFETESEHFQCDVSFELFSQLVFAKTGPEGWENGGEAVIYSTKHRDRK